MNVTDPDGDSLNFFILLQSAHGIVNIDYYDGSFTYTPHPDFHGIDIFIYTASDGIYRSNEAIVTITVNPITDITNDLIVTNEDTPITFNVLMGTKNPEPKSLEIT